MHICHIVDQDLDIYLDSLFFLYFIIAALHN